MFEKVLASLLRLYPSRFREEYEHEAFQLMQDRLRDETGFLRKTCLMWDLVTDGLFGLPQAYRNAHTQKETEMLPLAVEGIPSFHVLAEEPLSRGAIVLGGTLSLFTISAFGWLLNLSLAHAPTPLWNGHMSPIEAVVERLNQGMPMDTHLSEAAGASPSNSVRTSEGSPRIGLSVAASPSGAHRLGLALESRGVSEDKNRAVPIAVGNPPQTAVMPRAGTAVSQPIAWRGKLFDAAGLPVRSAEIHLMSETGERMEHTAADGSFAFSQLSSGDYDITIVCDGREVAYRKAHLSATSSPPRLSLASGGRLLVTQ